MMQQWLDFAKAKGTNNEELISESKRIKIVELTV